MEEDIQGANRILISKELLRTPYNPLLKKLLDKQKIVCYSFIEITTFLINTY